ncbi:LOW QUALITY PROTEIN: QWRF motif-containing protein 3-like [Primulina tabacum]|uniref:LOW QUALITY PROTEIN: QWRF motif-containing protein 3-like n=1 Tax=Primulina tabacum TaxID=48773 RepID=UPI003F5ABAEA
MKSHGGVTTISDHLLKPKNPKSREVSSKFLSPNSFTTTSSSSAEYGIQSANIILSPIKEKPRSSIDSKRHKSLENSGFLRGLWPSSSTLSPSVPLKPDTLADHLGNERLKDISETKQNQNLEFLSRQRSCTGLSRFESGKKGAAKENHRPIFGRSVGITGKFKFHGKSLKSSDLLVDQNGGHIEPGRFSVDGIALRNKSFGRGVASDSESEHSDLCSGSSFETQATGKKSQASYMAPTMSSRKHGVEDSPKFTHDLSLRSRRWSADSSACNPKPFSPDNNSSKIFTLKNSMKKTCSKWAVSPGRSSSPTAENTSSSKPPSSPSRGKGGVGNILSMGIGLLKGKKSSSSTPLSPLGPGSSADISHELRLLHNRLVQWRCTNARAEAVTGNLIKYAERDFLCARNSVVKLQHSVVQKKQQLQSEKLEIKLNSILSSHMEELETWGNMERQHLCAVTRTKDYLHGVVCRIPLVDGAKGEKPSVSFAVRHADDVAAAIDLKLTTCSPMMEKTAGLLAELATVVTREKLLLEECLELFRMISSLETRERSLKSSIMQSRSMVQRHTLLST